MKYICQICGYVYDEEKEPAGFGQLPEGWKCPVCGAGREAFRPEGSAEAGAEPVTGEYEKLSPGQLAALCSNLGRGCEKQYLSEEAELFYRLARALTRGAPVPASPRAEALAERLRRDAEAYPAVRAEADAARDRGAARVCVWGEKVTRMLSGLVDRYLRDGEPMLADTEIWVCTACGFVWIGDTPPETCPVCKVPAWKFERVEGRETA